MNIYLTSANPLHFSHINTMETAEKKIGGPVILGICSNINKTSGLFTLTERKQIAIKYYQIPEEKIRIYHEPEEIREAIERADRIIRGRRDYRDTAYIHQLAEQYGVSDQAEKLLVISIPNHLRTISSSRLIRMIYENDYRPEYKWVPDDLIPVIKDRLAAVGYLY